MFAKDYAQNTKNLATAKFWYLLIPDGFLSRMSFYNQALYAPVLQKAGLKTEFFSISKQDNNIRKIVN